MLIPYPEPVSKPVSQSPTALDLTNPKPQTLNPKPPNPKPLNPKSAVKAAMYKTLCVIRVPTGF